MSKPPVKRLCSELSPDHVSINMDDLDLSDNVKIKGLLREVLEEMGLNTVNSQLVDINTSIKQAKEAGEKAQKMAKNNKTEIDQLKSDMDTMNKLLQSERQARIRAEAHSRRSNLRFYGIPEKVRETDSDCEQAVREVVAEKMNISETFPIERCHRMGPRPQFSTTVGSTAKNKPRPRPIIVKFTYFKDREKVWRQKAALAGSNIIVKEDFPPELDERVNKMLPIFLAAKKQPGITNVRLVVDKLYLNGEMYTVETIKNLPEMLRPENLATRKNGDYTLFWRKESFLSNFHPSPFMAEGIEYSCVEQYYKAKMAMMFKDEEAHRRIMKSGDPAQMKRIPIKNFDPQLWSNSCLETMEEGLYSKFDQNPNLRDKLLQTAPTMLVEASPYDRFWGIGHSMNDPKVNDNENWGLNHLGKLLVKIRQGMT